VSKERLIVALDNFTTGARQVDTAYIARMVTSLRDYVGYFKIGLEAIIGIGAPDAVMAIRGSGGKVFLDGKFNDIPNTVGQASKRAAGLMGVEMFNVHASAGAKAMKAAVENKGKAKVLAVTVLTSLDEAETMKIFGRSSRNTVEDFAHDAIQDAGVDGIICSPKELPMLKQWFPDSMLVTPGIRPAWAATDDQKRFTTPAEAIKMGATHIVVGRPITNPPASIGSSVEAAKRILEEIENGSK